MNKKVFLVGADGGMGCAVANKLLDEGYQVVGGHYNSDSKISTISHKNFEKILINVGQLDSVQQTAKKIGEVFAVVNCSGIVDMEGKSLEEDVKIWEKTIAVNLSGNFYLGKVFENLIQENGRFIMISSTDAYYGGSITMSYSASKAGVNSLTKSFALSMKDKKVRVNTIAPGWVDTPMVAGEGKDFLKKLAKSNPLDRIGKPEDVANLISFLLSDKSDYINGQVITLDGGYTNQDPTLMLEEEALQDE